jgi:hypothetical protein
MLEVMTHGWIDCHYRRLVGYENWGPYVAETKEWIDLAVKKNMDLSICAHDWSSILFDANMEHTREIIAYAKASGLTPCTTSDYYEIKIKFKETGSL